MCKRYLEKDEGAMDYGQLLNKVDQLENKIVNLEDEVSELKEKLEEYEEIEYQEGFFLKDMSKEVQRAFYNLNSRAIPGWNHNRYVGHERKRMYYEIEDDRKIINDWLIENGADPYFGEVTIDFIEGNENAKIKSSLELKD